MTRPGDSQNAVLTFRRVAIIILITATWAWSSGSACGGDSDALGVNSAPPPIGANLGRLSSPSAKVRREAILALTEGDSTTSEVVLPRIWPLLQDTDPQVRLQAARAAWIVGQRSDVAIETLTSLLDDRQVPLCAMSTYLLGEIGPPARDALEQLRGLAASQDSLLRLHAAEAIVKIDATDAAAHSILIRAQRSSEAEARYFAACALLNAGPAFRDEIRAALIAALADEDLRIASAAALSLENWPATTADADSPPTGNGADSDLSRVMSNLGDASIPLRRQAAMRLASLPSIPEQARRRLPRHLADDDPLVRAYVARALWQAGARPESIVPALVDLLGTLHPNVTTLATSILSDIGPAAADALPALNDLLETGDAPLQLHVSIALSRIDPRSREAVQLLGQALRDNDSDRRYLAAISLGHVSILARRQAERQLTVALRDRNLRVRSAAARSLSNLQLAAAQARAKAAEVEVLPVASVGHAVDTSARAAVEIPELESAGNFDIENSDPLAIPDVTAGNEELPTPEEDETEAAQEEDQLAAIPVLQDPLETGPQPPPEQPQRGVEKQYDVDEETTEERKSIRALRARITPSEGDLPIDHAGPHFAMQPAYFHGYGTVRGWWNSSFAWEPPGVCHAPLYFQDLNLERYGYHYGCFQTVVSSVKFATDVALLPYKVAAESPCDCVYTLGYDRPGNCVPYRCYRLPWRTDAVLVLGGVATGLIFLAP